MKKALRYIILLISTIVCLAIRFMFFNGESVDYISFLNPWIIKIRSLGYFKSLKYNLGDYNIPYMFILTFISLFKCKVLYLIKIVSIIFDFVCAIFGLIIVQKITSDNLKSMIAYISILFLPTVITNSSMWGQCDSIYTAFTLISLYYLLNKKYTLSFIFLGISFAFKLQFIFILPLYVIMFFREKNIHIYHFLLIPIINIILCLPAVIAGRNIKDVLLIYFNQATEYKWLSMNFPNLYNFFDDHYQLINSLLVAKCGIILTFLIFSGMLIYVIIKKTNFNNEKIILLGLWSIVIATFFLPHMHERYMYAADILSVIYFVVYLKRFYIPVSINLASVLSYFKVLFGFDFINLSIVGIIYFIFVIIFSFYVFKVVGDKYEDVK